MLAKNLVTKSLISLSLLFSAALVVGQPISAPNGMVASAEPMATDVGVSILQQGGNAFDAAVAVGFALAVSYPQAGNIGGGGFFVGITDHGTPMALDFRETAPAAATKDMFLDDQGNPSSEKSLNSHLAVAVPGTVDGLLELHHKFGKLTLEQDMEPAISLARDGFKVSASLARSLASEADRLSKLSSTALIFYPDGKPLAEGAYLFQKDLAHTLSLIAKNGRAGFYEGETSRRIAEDMEQFGGLITQNDLKGYHSKWREAFVFDFGGYQVISHPLPSSGGVTLAQIAGLIDFGSLKAAGLNSASYARLLVEAERLAYADRNFFLGDPGFVKVPVSSLTSRGYLESRRKLIPAGGAGKSSSVAHGQPEHLETTHYTVADKMGNVASVTYTLNGSYGMGAIAPGAGFFLNNEMDDFTSKPGSPNLFGLVQGEANSIQPGKRPLSSMTPVIVKKGGRFMFALGSPGGATIITTVLQCLLNLDLFGMDLGKAVDAGRFHHQWLPDDVQYEDAAFSADTLSALQGMGYTMRKVRGLGLVNAVMRMPDGTFVGWSDKRGSGKAAGY